MDRQIVTTAQVEPLPIRHLPAVGLRLNDLIDFFESDWTKSDETK